MRSVAIQHALIALYRDGASDAAALVEPATAPRTSILRAGHEKMQRTLALSIRALANAAPGEGDRVHTDVCEVLGSPYATPEAVSRARARSIYRESETGGGGAGRGRILDRADRARGRGVRGRVVSTRRARGRRGRTRADRSGGARD